jgi:hypothetical protein
MLGRLAYARAKGGWGRMSYQNPIEIIFGEMQTKLEGDVLKVIQNYDITVDKNELLKALNYDRDQYHKGWSDGWVNAKWDIIRCKDCVYWQAELCSFLPDWHYCAMNNTDFRANDYCSRGERKGQGEENE